jgi:uncharacterized membrane protein
MSFVTRMVAARPRMFICALLALIAWFLFGLVIPLHLRTLATWNASGIAYIALVWQMMLRSPPDAVRTRARMQDESRWVILIILIAAAFFSLAAIVDVLHQVKEMTDGKGVSIALAGLTIVTSWFLIHTVFALHYAHEYYGDRTGKKATAAAGLDFPGDTKPNYADFLYFSFVVGMTCQVSDVCVSSKSMRALTLLHGVLAFFFNTVILALSINIAAGLL